MPILRFNSINLKLNRLYKIFNIRQNKILLRIKTLRAPLEGKERKEKDLKVAKIIPQYRSLLQCQNLHLNKMLLAFRYQTHLDFLKIILVESLEATFHLH
jgi:hypothetical protein